MGGCSSASHSSYYSKNYQPQVPSYLKKGTAVDKTLVGTMVKPALTVEGLPVEVMTQHWSVKVVVSGPTVPGMGLPRVQPATTCTWTITLSGATARVPISLADFNSIDHLGHIYGLQPAVGQPAPADHVDPGQTVTFEVQAYEIVGEGVMRWAPDAQHIVAEWDYAVEND